LFQLRVGRNGTQPSGYIVRPEVLGFIAFYPAYPDVSPISRSRASQKRAEKGRGLSERQRVPQPPPASRSAGQPAGPSERGAFGSLGKQRTRKKRGIALPLSYINTTLMNCRVSFHSTRPTRLLDSTPISNIFSMSY